METPERETPWREGEDGIITWPDDILVMGFPEGERERRKEMLKAARHFTGRTYSLELDIEIWGDWIIYILDDLYSAAFYSKLEEGLKTYGEVLKRVRDTIDEWLSIELETPDGLTDIL